MYPKDFIKNELKNFTHDRDIDSNIKSLLETLNTMKSATALYFDEKLYNSAKCFSEEMGNSGLVGHDRIKCVETNKAECCSYGKYTGKEVVFQLLFDFNVPSLGHREVCLSGKYSKIGVSVHTHKWISTICN